jgi:glycosyltransferase involved in cell wall biosynthesis
MKIAFIHPKRAFLPELAAYQAFFRSRNIETVFYKFGEEKGSDADVFWFMMGIYPGARGRGKKIIHEYSSSSVPPNRKLKDLIKSKLNPRPHFRLYHNEYVMQEIHHADGVPSGIRDQGVSDDFRPVPEAEKKYDFIYTGSLSPERRIDQLLHAFQQPALKERTILLLGQDYSRLAGAFSSSKNILFRGPVSREEIPVYLSEARFAINYIPDREPFNAQTSTKFLEYAAMQIPIISTKYYWLSQFQARYGGEYFFLKEDLSNLSWGRINAFNYRFPDMRSWHWEHQIRDSGVLDFLQSAFPEASF